MKIKKFEAFDPNLKKLTKFKLNSNVSLGLSWSLGQKWTWIKLT